jgi:hypothetical protein
MQPLVHALVSLRDILPLCQILSHPHLVPPARSGLALKVRINDHLRNI